MSWLCCCPERCNLGYYNASGVLQWVTSTGTDTSVDGIESILYMSEADSTGNIWLLIKHSTNGFRLQRYNTSGTAGTSITSISHPNRSTDRGLHPQIAQDSSGNVYYAYPEDVNPNDLNRIKKWNSSGTLQWTVTDMISEMGSTNRGSCSISITSAANIQKVLVRNSNLFVAVRHQDFTAARYDLTGSHQDDYGPTEGTCDQWLSGSLSNSNRCFATDGLGEFYTGPGDDNFEYGFFDSSDSKSWELNAGILTTTFNSGETWVDSSGDGFVRRDNGTNYVLELRSSTDGSVVATDTWQANTGAFPIDIHADDVDGDLFALGQSDKTGSGGNVVNYNSSLTEQWASDWGNTTSQKQWANFIRGDGAGGCYVATNGSLTVTGWAESELI